ncbi:MAG: hypothetical protein HYW38_01580 [Candidatus Colwellbacteria bacterium]|nr:hypothetical protein [Candidatus Colwellbacteria bacterium]
MPPQYPNPNSNLSNQLLTAQERIPSGVPRRFLTFSIILFLAMLFGYAVLALGYGPYLKGEINDSKTKLDALGRQISVEDQNELIRLYSQINNIERLLSSHVLASRILAFLETNTAQRVTYTGADLSIPDRRLILDGAAASYDELARQLAAYERAPEVGRTNLEGSEASGGVVRFRVSLILKPEVFKP